MADNQLKIRIQLPQSSNTESIEQYVIEPHKEVDKSEYLFDWHKIILALLLITVILGWIGYSINKWLNDVPSLDQTNSQQTPTGKTSGSVPPIEDKLQKVPTAPLNSGTSTRISTESNIIDDTPTSINIPKPRPKPIQPQSSVLPPPLPTNQAPHADVARIQLTSAITEHEPIDAINHIKLDHGTSKRVFLFIHLRNQGGQPVSVHWYHGTEEVSMVSLDIGNQNWRTSASKLFSNNQLGNWRVTLVDKNGNLLAQKNFSVSE